MQRLRQGEKSEREADLLFSGQKDERYQGHKEIADSKSAAATERSGIFDLPARRDWQDEWIRSLETELPARKLPR